MNKPEHPVKPVFHMDPISVTSDRLETNSFDVIVVGSGYGGGVAASRLSRAGRKVCVLERGREILPGDYPNSVTTAMAEMQISGSKVGNLTPGKNGMLDMRMNDDINVIVGCGLGGTSLINANVSLPCDPRTFQDPRWPAVFREEGMLDPFYDMASTMLGANPLPPQFNPNKLQALEASAKYMNAAFERPPINVTFQDGPNAAGVWQAACTMCGDCCSGCNYGAKNTTLMNYLPDAVRHGATIVTEARVTTVLQGEAGKWTVSVTDLSDAGTEKTIELTADIVVLGAGTLGSTEILMRSAKAGLPVSAENLGRGFSGNGDVLAFGFDANWKHAKTPDERAPVYGIGAGTNTPDWNAPQFMPGPCITGVIKVDMEDGKSGDSGLVIEEGVAPGALAMVYAAAFFFEEAMEGDLFRYPDARMRLEDIQKIGTAFQSGGDLAAMAYDGPISRTQTFLLMSHDDAGGQIRFDQEQDGVYVSWPGAGRTRAYLHDNDELREACDGIWANYLENPISLKPFGEKLVTVHPVGGCRMADSASGGVVNDRCAVFTGQGDATHDGLYVCDGSVMPTSLGLNPLLTISAVSERAMSLLIKEKGWEADAMRPAVPADTGPARPVTKDGEESQEHKEPEFLTTVVAGIDEIRVKLHHIMSLVESDLDAAQHAARDLIDDLIDRFGPESFLNYKKRALKASVWASLTENEMRKDLGPAIAEILEVLDHVSEQMTENAETVPWMTRVENIIGYLTDDIGDFSPGVSFDETMQGHVAAPVAGATGAVSDPYDIGENLGKARQGDMTANFRVVAPSVDAVLRKKSHPAALDGEVLCPLLPGGACEIVQGSGTFELLKQDDAHVETWLMVYSCQLAPKGDPDSPSHYFRGVKTLQRRPGSNWWTDLTTLFVDVWEGTDDSGTHVARGIIRLGLQQLTKQSRTVSSKFGSGADSDIVTTLFKDLLLWGNLHTELAKPETRTKILRKILSDVLAKLDDGAAAKVETAISLYFGKRVAVFFAMLIFRTYGGFLAYMKNFPATDPDPGDTLPVSGDMLRDGSKIKVEGFRVETSSGVPLQMLRARGGTAGPVILAPGFATKASSFALRTVRRNFVEMLCDEGFDVWMFDYRGSPALGSTSLSEFTIDDIAHQDWPAAVDRVLEETGASQVQIVAHCMGSMSCLMALLCGALDKSKVKSLISSQLTTHPVTNWFNQMKADTRVTSLIRNGVPASLHGLVEQVVPSPAMAELFFGMETIDANSTAALPPEPGKRAQQEQDQAIDLMVWKVPFPHEEPCYSPTCHRIYGIYGPVYLHSQLNEATHDAIKDIFGRISTKPFLQIAEMMRRGEAVGADGADIYLPHHQNLELPITFIAGALNSEFLPDTSLRTIEWLQRKNPEYRDLYHRHVFSDYGHMDCFIGRNADRDIFPFIIDRLKTPVPSGA
jgi:choline dehydrogenase-like flavoprotein